MAEQTIIVNGMGEPIVVMTNDERARRIEEKKAALTWALGFTEELLANHELSDYEGDGFAKEPLTIFHQRPPTTMWSAAEQHLSMVMNTAGWLLEEE